jgi:hypothetical protein
MVDRDQVQEMRPAQILIGSVGGLTRQTIWLVYPALLQNDPMLCWLICHPSFSFEFKDLYKLLAFFALEVKERNMS